MILPFESSGDPQSPNAAKNFLGLPPQVAPHSEKTENPSKSQSGNNQLPPSRLAAPTLSNTATNPHASGVIALATLQRQGLASIVLVCKANSPNAVRCNDQQ
ncbi:hypothetical protein PtA15_3A429 [Puccinia triticina]|uniref:Uncharacterized protein n=1 Tax=Puccinia triticina TaxID=208348 RepID=A0ABY7CF02_9BASI|nr:uncharacterized protein PtA15_3A429 [Puccinia triticina]WAQ83062.1 hypothetical protein PtA15_3A429 [Puccinia triticina]